MLQDLWDETVKFVAGLSPVFWWIFNSIVVVVAVAVLGTWISNKQRDRVRVRLARPGSSQVAKFVELYQEIIPTEDQIAPDRITRFLSNRKQSPRTRGALKRATQRRPFSNIHILLLAERAGDCVGFLKAILCAEGRVLFLAYLGTSAQGVAANLIGNLYARLSRLAGKRIAFFVFEVAADERGGAVSRMRKFESYARERGLQTRRVDVYLLPDMDFVDPSSTREIDGTLCIATIQGQEGADDPATIREIVSAIYKDVYGETFNEDPETHARYLTYLDVVEELVYERLEPIVVKN